MGVLQGMVPPLLLLLGVVGVGVVLLLGSLLQLVWPGPEACLQQHPTGNLQQQQQEEEEEEEEEEEGEW
jgi:hypothetical protein